MDVALARLVRAELREVGAWRVTTLRPTSRCVGWIGAAAGLITFLSCAPGASPAGPTPQAAATQIATAVQPAASPAAAAASPVATGAAAVASPAAATAIASSPMQITAAQLSPADSTITIVNAGGAPVDMSGWRLRVGTATATLPGSARAAPGESVTIHTAGGTSTARDIYLGAEGANLLSGLQPRARIALEDARGTAVSEFTLP
jgi:hypothetical protein